MPDIWSISYNKLPDLKYTTSCPSTFVIFYKLQAHLAEADAYSNKHPNPLLEQLQQAKPGDVSEEDDKSDSNESDSNESGTNSEREEEGSEIDEDNYSESEAGTIDAIDNESDIEIDDSPVKSKEKKDKTEKNVDLEELMQHNWKIIEDRRNEIFISAIS